MRFYSTGLFIGVVQRLGRSHEAATLGLFKVLSHTPKTQDMDAGFNLFIRGKVPVLPHYSAKAAAEVRQIFRKSESEETISTFRTNALRLPRRMDFKRRT